MRRGGAAATKATKSGGQKRGRGVEAPTQRQQRNRVGGDVGDAPGTSAGHGGGGSGRADGGATAAATAREEPAAAANNSDKSVSGASGADEDDEGGILAQSAEPQYLDPRVMMEFLHSQFGRLSDRLTNLEGKISDLQAATQAGKDVHSPPSRPGVTASTGGRGRGVGRKLGTETADAGDMDSGEPEATRAARALVRDEDDATGGEDFLRAHAALAFDLGPFGTGVVEKELLLDIVAGPTRDGPGSGGASGDGTGGGGGSGRVTRVSRESPAAPRADGAAPGGPGSSSVTPLSPSRPVSVDNDLRLLHYAAPVLCHSSSEAYFRRSRSNTKSLFEAWIGIVAADNDKDVLSHEDMKPFMQEACALATTVHARDGCPHSVKDMLVRWYAARETIGDPVAAPASETATAWSAFAANFALNDMRARKVSETLVCVSV
jgi:hypothetical protein